MARMRESSNFKAPIIRLIVSSETPLVNLHHLVTASEKPTVAVGPHGKLVLGSTQPVWKVYGTAKYSSQWPLLAHGHI